MLESQPQSEFLDLKNYQKLAFINQGGMGEVYLAQDNRLNRTVAIKILKTNSNTSDCTQQSLLDNALTEARFLARLNHPNIVQLYDIEKEGDQIALIMEHINGKTLYNFQKENVIGLIQKLNIISQISAGLAAAHAKGVIHCDLKPSNIIISENGTVKIVDFGIARLFNENSDNDSSDENRKLPKTNSKTLGSINAMSPEQINNAAQHGEQEIDYRSDLFSLGIIAFNLLSGFHPVNSTTAQQTSKSITENQITNAKDIVPKLPTELISLLNKLLAFQKKDRPTSSDWVHKQFQQITIALTQQELLQETRSLSPAVINEQSQLLKKRSKEIKNNSLLQLKTSPYLLMAILIIATMFILWTMKTEQKIRNVAVLPVTFTGDSQISTTQKEFITNSIYDALNQSIINNKSLRLVPRKELIEIKLETNNLFVKVAAISGATDIITTQLHCNNVKCQVTLSRLIEESNDSIFTLSPQDSSKTRNWHIQSQQQWPTLLENFNHIYQTTQSHIRNIFSQYQSRYLKEGIVDDQAYADYTKIYTQLAINSKINESHLTALAGIIKKYPYLFSAYTLYREKSLDLYNITKDSKYIVQLQNIMQIAPPEYRYSVFQAIDTFHIAIATNNPKLSTQQLTIIKERGIDETSLIELRAYSAFFQEDWGQAINYYQNAIILRPSSNFLYNLALSYVQLGDNKNAKRYLNKSLKITPDKYEENQLIADIHLLEGNIDLAIFHYQKTLAMNIQSADLSSLALAYLLSNQHDNALLLAQKAVDLAPQHPSWRLNLADIQFMSNATSQALINYKKVVDLQEGKHNLTSYLELAQAYVHLGDFDKAIKAINHAKKLTSTKGEIAYVASLVYSVVGEHISALTQVESALAADVAVIWFNFPWFDSLCKNTKFTLLMAQNDGKGRCQFTPQKTKSHVVILDDVPQV